MARFTDADVEELIRRMLTATTEQAMELQRPLSTTEAVTLCANVAAKAIDDYIDAYDPVLPGEEVITFDERGRIVPSAMGLLGLTPVEKIGPQDEEEESPDGWTPVFEAPPQSVIDAAKAIVRDAGGYDIEIIDPNDR